MLSVCRRRVLLPRCQVRGVSDLVHVARNPAIESKELLPRFFNVLRDTVADAPHNASCDVEDRLLTGCADLAV